MILDVEIDDGLVAKGGFEEGKVAKRATDLSIAKRLGGFYWCEKYLRQSLKNSIFAAAKGVTCNLPWK